VLGQPGAVRVKSDGCIAAYQDDPSASARMFRNGWFYPGDTGVMADPHALRLLGRTDELLNLGGLKIDPELIEARLNQLVSAQDLCITTAVGKEGKEQFWVAVVPDTSMTLDTIRNVIGPKAQKTFGSIGFIKLKKIPRTPAGKVQRNMLRALIQDRLSGSTASQG
jgi:acyl-coenzyme A synthetase/AMP-(fatty) acid ligase